MRITVPANVLLLGEYAVLEEGGIGVVLAVEPRIVATVSNARRLEISGSWGGRRTDWTDAEEPDLFGSAVEAVASLLGTTTAELRGLPLRVEIDSTDFYDASGAKRGFGSSAAVSVVLCCALLDCATEGGGRRSEKGGSAPSRLLESTFACALRAHRAFQGGRGSGYDVAASTYGGVGRFVGGVTPRYLAAALPWLPPLSLVRGSAPVRTRDAVTRYEAWKSERPRRAARFLERSNECAEGFLAAADWTEAARWVEGARDLAIELGSEIGAPARIDRPTGFEGIVKAVGAGDELGVAFGAFDTVRGEGFRSVEPLSVALRGITAEESSLGSADDLQG